MTNYAKNWNKYYDNTYNLLKSKSLWEVNPDVAVSLDLLKFKDSFNPDLPIIDIGCGTGEQANFLGIILTRLLDWM